MDGVKNVATFDVEFELDALAFDAALDVTVTTATGSYTLPAATGETLGGIKVGSDLEITPEGVLSVQKATGVEADNTHPITAAAVYTEVGNIDVLLKTI